MEGRALAGRSVVRGRGAETEASDRPEEALAAAGRSIVRGREAETEASDRPEEALAAAGRSAVRGREAARDPAGALADPSLFPAQAAGLWAASAGSPGNNPEVSQVGRRPGLAPVSREAEAMAGRPIPVCTGAEGARITAASVAATQAEGARITAAGVVNGAS